ncbi:hypothetical protein J6590_014223 [Homalodisca vitripennis]|nr:hypothetical protein J6590_014223 [Homalodisca vitripennis]
MNSPIPPPTRKPPSPTSPACPQPIKAKLFITDGSKTKSGIGAGILGVRPCRWSLWVSIRQFFRRRSQLLWNVLVRIFVWTLV